MKIKPISSIVKIYGFLLIPSPMGFGCNPPQPKLDYNANPPAPMEPYEPADTADAEDSGDTAAESDTEDTATPEDSGNTGEESDTAETGN